VGKTALADALSDFKISFPGVFEQFGQFETHVRVIFEQQLFEHDAVDADHLLQMRSKKVHESACLECLVR
jgi:hypothetical protein